MTRYEALLAAAKAYCSQQAMGDACGVTQPTVWRWLHQSKQLPAEHVLQVERDTGISRHDLRPDIYPREQMIDRLVEDRFAGIDLRAKSAADRRVIGARFAGQQKVA